MGPASPVSAGSTDDPFTSDDLYLQLAFSDDVDEALLMMISSHMEMQKKGEATKIGILIGHYEDQLERLKKAELEDSTKATVQTVLIQQMAQKIQDLRKQQDILEKSEGRRRPRGIFGALIRGGGWFIGRTARLTGKLVGGVGRGTGRLMQLVIEEELPERIEKLVMRRLRELGDVFQGKIDLIWRRIADKYGGKFATWLRSKVDPEFVRMRNGIARKLGLPVTTIQDEPPVDGGFVLDMGVEYFDGRFGWGTFGLDTAEEETACECVGISTEITAMSLHLEFDFEAGTVGGWIRNGELSYVGEEGKEFVKGSFDAALGGTVEPTDDGKWEFRGTASLSIVVEGKMICGRIVRGDDTEYVFAEGGAEVPRVIAAFSGGSDSQMTVGGGQFYLAWKDDESLDCHGGPSMSFEIFNPYDSPFPHAFPPVPG
ncbi:MAG: hypothetical protein HXS50_04290 [Theionarchaea archaeon]|nr:hypothetical protein [Theionarchaea archaeon]